MPGYMIGRVKVTDAEKYREYTKASPATIEKYGGKFLVRGGETVTLEGSAVEERVVVIEFPGLEQVKTWYYSTEYQTVKKLREDAASASFIAVSGLE